MPEKTQDKQTIGIEKLLKETEQEFQLLKDSFYIHIINYIRETQQQQERLTQKYNELKALLEEAQKTIPNEAVKSIP